MEFIKLELNKIEGAEIVDGYICIPLPEANKSKKGMYYSDAKGNVYLDCVLWRNEDDQPDDYGNHGSLQVSVSKDERDAGEKGAYIGRYKFV